MSQNRRDFLKSSGTVAAAATTPFWFPLPTAIASGKSPNERLTLGCIGTGSRWGAVGPGAMKFADCAAVCDADANHAGRAKDRVKQAQPGDKQVDVYEDYRKILDRDDIDVVTIVTPDHWHTKIAVEAMKAGKDVYCEKPLTLTIDEGKIIRKTLKETGRVFQVGTQQRSEMGLKFLRAAAIVREGRIGELKKVTCAIGGGPTSGAIPKADVPTGLNWDLWLGQAPMVDYRSKPAKRWPNSRCHYEFRWWYEYSGGKMTDWGAHHVDIAQWAMALDHTGPVSVEPVMAKFPVPYKDGRPTDDSQYNTATRFDVKVMFANGMELRIRDTAEDLGFKNGIMFQGTKGRFFVNRGKLTGLPVEQLEENPLDPATMTKLYKGKKPGSHMRNFFECIATREQPISDVDTHHRAMTTCHLANISTRLGRTLNFDPETEMIVGDDDAAQWQSREQRKGYEIEA
ncbi:MAG: Gfo/Idh/MocA family oxidoreductase [Planctomycetaceae bacterium]